jgi:hypothetical protein
MAAGDQFNKRQGTPRVEKRPNDATGWRNTAEKHPNKNYIELVSTDRQAFKEEKRDQR